MSENYNNNRDMRDRIICRDCKSVHICKDGTGKTYYHQDMVSGIPCPSCPKARSKW